MMRAVWYEAFGKASDVLTYGEKPDPEPTDGDVLVRLKTSGLNPVDTKRRLGGRGDMPGPYVIPGFDGAGIIEAVGAGVDQSRIGERVWLYNAQFGRTLGTSAELCALPAHLAVPMADSVSFDDGACLRGGLHLNDAYSVQRGAAKAALAGEFSFYARPRGVSPYLALN